MRLFHSCTFRRRECWKCFILVDWGVLFIVHSCSRVFRSCRFGRRAYWKLGFSKLSSKTNGRSVDPSWSVCSCVARGVALSGRGTSAWLYCPKVSNVSGSRGVLGPRESYQEKVNLRMVSEQSSVLARSPPLRAGVQQEPAPSSDMTGVPRL